MSIQLHLQDLTTIYVTTQGTSLSINNKRLIAKLGGEVIGQALLNTVERICVFGAVHISQPLVDFCLRTGVTIHYFSTHGIYKGALIGEEIKSYRILEAQILTDEKHAIPLIKNILSGQIESRITLLKRKQIDTTPLVQIRKKLKSADTIDSVRGYEGQAAAIFWESFPQLLKDKSLFNGRTRRPPKDIANSLLSLGYTLLSSELEGPVRYYGLNPYKGYLHLFRHGRKSLILDLVEQFRPVIEQFTITLLNRKEITPKHFQREGIGYYLTDEGKKKYFARYEELMRKRYKNEVGEMTLRNIAQLQVQKFVSWLDSGKEYLPLQIK